MSKRPIRTKKSGLSGPLISVLISTYNRPEFLAEALESVFAQTYPNFQIVLVRDGGLPVRDVVAPFEDSRLTFIDRDENRGLPYSFNEAMDAARGKYICYLGDDDRYFPHHFQTLLEAIEGQDRCGVVYSDLYKAHCRPREGGRRIVLAKNVEISRDFDRMLMLQFNHALHVSLMHQKDLIDRAGPCNEKLNVLIDWDLTRRLCFYTDFLHVPVVTGEYYAPVGDCDRISVQRRKNVNEYLRNLLTIRSSRPPKPWDCIEDLSIIVTARQRDEKLDQTLRNLWSHTFYPAQIYVPLTPDEQYSFETVVPNVVPVTVAEDASPGQRIDQVLSACRGPYVALMPAGLQVEQDEVGWVERSLVPLLNSSEPNRGFELPESRPECWGGVFRYAELLAVRKQFGHLPPRESLQAAGIEMRKPEYAEYPFQFDNALTAAEQIQREGNWLYAAKMYEVMSEQYGNDLWMQTRRANALYRGGRWQEAGGVIHEVNRQRPTVSTLLLEGRILSKQKQYQQAVDLLERAEAVLSGNHQMIRPIGAGPSYLQETHAWI